MALPSLIITIMEWLWNPGGGGMGFALSGVSLAFTADELPHLLDDRSAVSIGTKVCCLKTGLPSSPDVTLPSPCLGDDSDNCVLSLNLALRDQKHRELRRRGVSSLTPKPFIFISTLIFSPHPYLHRKISSQ